MKITYPKELRLKDIVICLLIGISIMFIIVTIIEAKENKKNNLQEVIEFTPCYKDSIANFLIELKVKYPHIVLSQSIIESGNYTSKIFLENNNPFGMKLSWNRATTALGIKNGYAYYSNLRDAIIDYAFMQSSYYRSAKTEEDYYILLQKSYAEDKEYINKVRKIANKLK
ncbi:hypothetical protein DAC20_139 [Bacteroides phage DAC20]|nr:hypothetical protein DAC19_140 [Bacteroides phage DAC19]QIG63892.1 hypothetical protein DAC20_139 [Bacteroides phage DAC20]QIG64155.1 hypothetical protein DAC22_141 [Bacteroides phage DAC22]QIG64412.1 hypothetical protein DAC23_134 [Bacteroides phage DAC23]